MNTIQTLKQLLDNETINLVSYIESMLNTIDFALLISYERKSIHQDIYHEHIIRYQVNDNIDHNAIGTLMQTIYQDSGCDLLKFTIGTDEKTLRNIITITLHN